MKSKDAGASESQQQVCSANQSGGMIQSPLCDQYPSASPSQGTSNVPGASNARLGPREITNVTKSANAASINNQCVCVCESVGRVLIQGE